MGEQQFLAIMIVMWFVGAFIYVWIAGLVRKWLRLSDTYINVTCVIILLGVVAYVVESLGEGTGSISSRAAHMWSGERLVYTVPQVSIALLIAAFKKRRTQSM